MTVSGSFCLSSKRCLLFFWLFSLCGRSSWAWSALPLSPRFNRRDRGAFLLPQWQGNEYDSSSSSVVAAAAAAASACCAKCQLPLSSSSTSSSSSALSASSQIIQTHQNDDKLYHAACFTCHDCGQAIQGPFHSAAVTTTTTSTPTSSTPTTGTPTTTSSTTSTPTTTSSTSNAMQITGGGLSLMNNRHHHPDHHHHHHHRRHEHANAVLSADHQALYHPECFKKRMGLMCDYCGDLLADEWTEFQGRKYHTHCYNGFVQAKCVVCQQSLEGAWTISDPWGNVAHAQHERHGATETCASCQRILTPETTAALPDGRMICGACSRTAVTQSAQISHACRTVMRDLHSVLSKQQHHQQQQLLLHDSNNSNTIKGWQGQIQIHLADRQVLANKAQQAGVLAHSHGNSNFHGLTTTTRITTALRTIEPQTFTTMEHEIVLLNSLPELQFKGVLAHELLHVWLNEAGITPASPQLVEGFCNLGSWLVYQQEANRGRRHLDGNNNNNNNSHSSNNNNAQLAQVLLQQLQNDPDVVYGDGYRALKQVLERSGWQGVLHKLITAPPQQRQ